MYSYPSKSFAYLEVDIFTVLGGSRACFVMFWASKLQHHWHSWLPVVLCVMGWVHLAIASINWLALGCWWAWWACPSCQQLNCHKIPLPPISFRKPPTGKALAPKPHNAMPNLMGGPQAPNNARGACLGGGKPTWGGGGGNFKGF